MSSSAELAFASKAELLEALRPHLRCAKVLRSVIISCDDWRRSPEIEIARIEAEAWSQGPLMVRSSAFGEDHHGMSMAGHFLSVGNVLGTAALKAAVDDVIASYAKGRRPQPSDQVFIQPFLADVQASGVATSRDPVGGGRYRVISWTMENDTGLVTRGADGDFRTWYGLEGFEPSPELPIGSVLRLVDELEEVLDVDHFELEFAIADDLLYLLQVRPILGPQRQTSDREHFKVLSAAVESLQQIFAPADGWHGSTTVLANMADWNPAELIGCRPRPLAFGLYDHIVTERAWSERRADYGYRDSRRAPLMVDVAGHPYVDTRRSFNSLVPAGLSPQTAEILVEAYLDRLARNPSLQDKIEFEVVISSCRFDFWERVSRYDLGQKQCEELFQSLVALTNNVVSGRAQLLDTDISAIAEIQAAQSDRDVVPEHVAATRLWQAARLTGAPAFAGIARAAFIAVDMFRSAVITGLLDKGSLRQFMQSLDTVTAKAARDIARLPKADFLKLYGHLRPGTYDITSARYDEAHDLYFREGAAELPRKPVEFALSRDERRRLGRALNDQGLDFDVDQFLTFARDSIIGREWSKFVFSKLISDGLARLSAYGRRLGLSADDLSYCDMPSLLRLSGFEAADRELLVECSRLGRERYALTEIVALPPVLTSPDQLFCFELPSEEPNFITHGSVRGPVASLHEDIVPGSIVVMMNADPGHDWIFTRGVAGFCTAYGGVNSHMAVRAQELQLPAVIGAGERRIRQWSAAAMLEIDAGAQTVRVLV